MTLPAKSYADVQVVQPQGRIDHNSSNEFQSGLVGAVEAADSCTAVVLDMSGVEYMSSAGLRVLMVALKSAKENELAFVIAALTPTLQEIFEISRFNVVFSVFDTVGEALAAQSEAAAAAFDG